MQLEQLEMSGTGAYDIGITLEPMPHLRGNRTGDWDILDEYPRGVIPLARIKGGTLAGASRADVNSFEANLLAPEGVEDYDGSRVILASFEFHSLMLDNAHNGVIRYKGFLSAADAHPQEVYESLVDLTKPEEFEKVPALTTVTGGLKYFPPKYEAAQRFIGWQANLTMRTYV